MITDSIDNLHLYDELHPNFRSLFDILQALNLECLQLGHIELDGTYVYIDIFQSDGIAENEARLENHHRYIDLHIPLSADEQIAYRSASQCSRPISDYDESRDVQFFSDSPSETIHLRARGDFAIFFPDEAHAPSISASPSLMKLVAKISLIPNQEKPTL